MGVPWPERQGEIPVPTPPAGRIGRHLSIRLSTLLLAALSIGCAADRAAGPAPVAAVPTPAEAPTCRVPGDQPMLTLTDTVLPSSEVVVAAVGDVLLHDAVQEEAARAPTGHFGLWSDLAALLGGADITYANLEGPLADGVTAQGRLVDHPVGVYDGAVYSGYPMFNYPSTVAAALARAGVDVVSTANNHSLDRYGIGVDRTLAALAAAGVRATGTRHSAGPAAPWHAITEARGYRIAWLACTYGTNGIPDPAGQVLMCYDDRQEVLDTIRRLATDPAIDAVIATPHWGAEYSHDPLDRQRDLARQMLDAGAAAVIGSHPHVVQPLERVTTADGRLGLVAYSLGNFVSNQRSLARRTSIVLLVSLAEGSDGRLHAAAARWVPIGVDFATAGDGRSIRVRPLRTPGAGTDPAHDLLTSVLGPSGQVAATAPLRALGTCDAVSAVSEAATPG